MAIMGTQALSMFNQFQADKAEYKAKAAWQKYSNTMTRLSDSVNQNVITTNELLAYDASQAESNQIKRDSLFTSAKIEVAAAAADTKGRSVNQAMFDVQRNAAARQSERQVSFKNQVLAFDQQRVSSRMSADASQDYSYLPKPKAASYILKAGMSMGQTYMGSK